MKQLSRTEYALRNMLTGMAGHIVNMAAGFVCRIVFVRTLSADYLGISGLFSNILSMLSLAELGISSAITYALYRPIAENDEQKIASIMDYYRRAYRVIGCAVAVMGLALLPFLDVLLQNPPAIREDIRLLYLLYLLSTVASYFFSYRGALLTAMQRQYVVSGCSYAVTIAQSILQVLYLLLTHDYLGYLLIQLAGGIAYNLWISRKAAKDYPYIRSKKPVPLSKEEKRGLFRNIKALAVSRLSGVLVGSTDNIAITCFTGIGSVGLASNYTLLSSTLDALITRLFNDLTGSVGNLNATADEGTRYRFFKALNLANFWLYGWAALGMAFVSEDLVRWFFGDTFVLPPRIPLILAANLFTIGMLHASYTYKSTLGLFRYGQHLLFFTGILNLALDVLFGRLWGVFGIYLATLIARLCTNAWYEPYAVYRYGLKRNPLLYYLRYLRFLLVLGAAGFLCWAACGLCSLSPAGNTCAKALICTFVPNSVFWLAFRKTEEFSYLARRLTCATRREGAA